MNLVLQQRLEIAYDFSLTFHSHRFNVGDEVPNGIQDDTGHLVRWPDMVTFGTMVPNKVHVVALQEDVDVSTGLVRQTVYVKHDRH